MFNNKKVTKIKKVVDYLYESISHNPATNCWSFNFTCLENYNKAVSLCKTNNLKTISNKNKKNNINLRREKWIIKKQN